MNFFSSKAIDNTVATAVGLLTTAATFATAMAQNSTAPTPSPTHCDMKRDNGWMTFNSIAAVSGVLLAATALTCQYRQRRAQRNNYQAI